MVRRYLKLFITLSLVFCFWGCDGMQIDKVKDGTLNGYKQTTIGKAIASVLGDVEWEYFETDKGIKVVEAKGTPGEQTIDFIWWYFREERFLEASHELPVFSMENLGSWELPDLLELQKKCTRMEKVRIQFILLANSDDFEVGACGYGKRVLDCTRLLKHVYDNNVHYVPMQKKCSAVSEAILKFEKAKEKVESSKGTLADSRDGKTYKTIVIGSQTWMAENLNYQTANSQCYAKDPKMCAKYGRLYEWDDAVGACPNGWHLPSEQELRTLLDVVGYSGKKLKSANGWKNGLGTDEVGFSVLPASADKAYFWTSTSEGWDDPETNTCGRDVMYMKLSADSDEALTEGVDVHSASRRFSVRCIKD